MIEYLSLKRITAMHKDEINKAISNVVASGWYLNGNAVKHLKSIIAPTLVRNIALVVEMDSTLYILFCVLTKSLDNFTMATK